MAGPLSLNFKVISVKFVASENLGNSQKFGKSLITIKFLSFQTGSSGQYQCRPCRSSLIRVCIVCNLVVKALLSGTTFRFITLLLTQ